MAHQGNRQQVIHRRDELADRSKRSGSSIISLAAFASSDPLRSHNDVGFSGQLEAVWPGTLNGIKFALGWVQFAQIFWCSCVKALFRIVIRDDSGFIKF